MSEQLFEQPTDCRHGSSSLTGCPFCMTRSTDPDTSHDAAASVTNRITLRHRIQTALAHHGPMTDEEIVAHLSPHGSPSGIRTRRKELVDDGLVQRTAADGMTSSGRRCAGWALTLNAPEVQS